MVAGELMNAFSALARLQQVASLYLAATMRGEIHGDKIVKLMINFGRELRGSITSTKIDCAED